jgi:hypothetical protein
VRKRPGQPGPLLTAAGLVALIALLGGWWVWPWREKYSVPVPSAGASARQVVIAYLRSLDAHDNATALALSTPGFRSTTSAWLASTAGVTHIDVRPLQCFRSGPDRCDVQTTFNYASHWWKQDDSFPDGPETWGYFVVRRGGRWLINDDGNL